MFGGEKSGGRVKPPEIQAKEKQCAGGKSRQMGRSALGGMASHRGARSRNLSAIKTRAIHATPPSQERDERSAWKKYAIWRKALLQKVS